MRQQLLVGLQSVTLQDIDHSFHIYGFPQGELHHQQRQSAGAIARIFRFSVPDFCPQVQEYCTRQRVTSFTYIQPRLYPWRQCRIAEPVEHRQRSLNAANFTRCLGLTILFGIADPFFQHQGCRYGSLLYWARHRTSCQ